jgi:hypothetical protein
MGAMISTVVYQPILLGTASTLMIIALMYQMRSCSKSNTPGDNATDNYGSEIFKLNMGISIVIVIAAVIIGIISAFTV